MNRLCRIMLIIISQYFCRLRSTLCGFILRHQPSRFVARFYSQPQSNHYSMTLVTTSTVFSRFSLLKYFLSHCWHHWGCLMERHLPAIPQSQASNHVYVVCHELQRHCVICQLAFKWWLPSASNMWNCETKIFIDFRTCYCHQITKTLADTAHLSKCFILAKRCCRIWNCHLSIWCICAWNYVFSISVSPLPNFFGHFPPFHTFPLLIDFLKASVLYLAWFPVFWAVHSSPINLARNQNCNWGTLFVQTNSLLAMWSAHRLARNLCCKKLASIDGYPNKPVNI